MTADLFRVGGFLPDIELPCPSTGRAVNVQAARGESTVLMTLHSADCPECREYLVRLNSLEPEFQAWEGRLLVAVPGSAHITVCTALVFGTVICDASTRIADGSLKMVVADRFGQIFYVSVAGASHDLPTPADLAEWLKFLGTLCPE